MIYDSMVDYYIDNRNGLIAELATRGTKYKDIFTAISAFDFVACDAIKNAVIAKTDEDMLIAIRTGTVGIDYNEQEFLKFSLQQVENAIREYNEGILNMRKAGYSDTPEFNVEAFTDYMEWAAVESNVENDNNTTFYTKKAKISSRNNSHKEKIVELFPSDDDS